MAMVPISNSGVLSTVYVIIPFARLRDGHSMAVMKKVDKSAIKTGSVHSLYSSTQDNQLDEEDN